MGKKRIDYGFWITLAIVIVYVGVCFVGLLKVSLA